MAGVNRAMLIGHVGQDAEVRYTGSGQAVANFSLATSETYKKEGEEKQTTTEWHNIVVWGKRAEVAGQYIKKGKFLYIEGKLQTKSWVDDKGVKHWKTEINLKDFQFLDKKGDGQSDRQPDVPATARGNDEYDIGDLGPPLDMDDNPLSPGD